MQTLLKVVLVVILVWVAGKACSQKFGHLKPRMMSMEEYNAFMQARNGWGYRRHTVRTAPAPSSSAAAPQPRLVAPPIALNGQCTNPACWLAVAAAKYQVPPELLAGIWTNESGRSPYSIRPNQTTRTAAALYASGRCTAGRTNCLASWNAVLMLCNQNRGGSKLCDPHTVLVAPAFDLGPMQFVTAFLVTRCDARYQWSSYVDDLDGDGVFDPLTPADAFGTAAKMLRSHQDGHCKSESQDWRCAIGSYAAGGENWRQTRRNPRYAKLAAKLRVHYGKVVRFGTKYCAQNPAPCGRGPAKPTLVASSGF